MTEPASNTSNHQRLEEMMSHLTPLGAVIPYNLCIDLHHHIWIASKGGLFKLDSTGTQLLWAERNPFPKKISPYTQVLHHDSKIIHAQTDDRDALTDFKILDLNGEVFHQQFIDGKVQSLAVNNQGDIFMSKQLSKEAEESTLYKASMDCPLGWEELSTSLDFAFQSICVYDSKTLQSIKWVDSNSGDLIGSFGVSGKEDEQIYFPRCMQRYKDDLLVMDKTGRFQLFTRQGQFSGVAATIDAYLGNGFALRGDQDGDGVVEAIVACSGIVQEKTLCDDWLEVVKLDGSRWEADK